MFARVTDAVRNADNAIRATLDRESVCVASRYNGALHLKVGNNCACLGVPYDEVRPNEGWCANGHNLDYPDRILLVLVALAALEDEYRAARGIEL